MGQLAEGGGGRGDGVGWGRKPPAGRRLARHAHSEKSEWETQSSYEFRGEFWGEIAHTYTHAHTHTRTHKYTHDMYA